MIRDFYVHLESNPGDWHARKSLILYLRGDQPVPFADRRRGELARLQLWFIENGIYPTNNIWIAEEDEEGNEDPDLMNRFCVFNPVLQNVTWSLTDTASGELLYKSEKTPKHAILPQLVVYAIDQANGGQTYPWTSPTLMVLELDMAYKMNIAKVIPEDKK